MNNTNIFEQASRLKLRFTTFKGIVSVEDLWSFKLDELDKLAHSYAKDIKTTVEESYIPSFIKRVSKEEALASLKFEIIKHIIVTLATEQETKAQAKEKAEKKTKILDIIAKKQDEALESKSVEELMKDLDSL